MRLRYRPQAVSFVSDSISYLSSPSAHRGLLTQRTNNRNARRRRRVFRSSFLGCIGDFSALPRVDSDHMWYDKKLVLNLKKDITYETTSLSLKFTTTFNIDLHVTPTRKSFIGAIIATYYRLRKMCFCIYF